MQEDGPFMKKRKAFSMIELVFAIVILGALAAVATTWLFQTRIDSQIALLRSDVSSLLSQVPAEVMAGNMNVSPTPPKSFSTWGDWLIHIGALDEARWKSTGDGVVAVSYINSGKKAKQKICKGDYLYIDTKAGIMHFMPKNIQAGDSVFCRVFKDSYNLNSEVKIYLNHTGALKY